MELHDREAALEAVLFAAGEPVTRNRLCKVLDIDEETLDALATRLSDHCRFERRGIRLVRMDDLYQLCSAPEHSIQVHKILEERRPPPMSKASLEVLTIIAYYQPATRAFVEQIRGVDSIYAINTLLDKKLIEECGRLEVPGRPNLYRTTAVFLRAFGLNALSDLPELPTLSTEGGQLRLTHFGLTDESGARIGEEASPFASIGDDTDVGEEAPPFARVGDDTPSGVDEEALLSDN